LYFFSDGFKDQFGGKNNRKYLTQRFYQFIHSISAKPFNQHLSEIETEFINWKGKNPQLDDVLIFGVRL